MKTKLIKFVKRVKRGMTLVELLGVMVVLAILAGISIGGISAARDNANTTSIISDLRTYDSALKQVFMLHPEIMKFTADKPANAIEKVVTYVNEQMESNWRFEVLSGVNGCGAVATSSIKRDAYGNAYTMYIYFDDKTPTYNRRDGTALVDSDSCVYIVIASPGKNSTGIGVGVNGDNYDATTKKIVNASLCVNNTDGIDDVGLICRILNGDTFSVTFGNDKAALGRLEKVQWCFGIPDATGGIVHDFAVNTNITATNGGSIDQFYDNISMAALTTPCWVGGQVSGSSGE